MVPNAITRAAKKRTEVKAYRRTIGGGASSCHKRPLVTTEKDAMRLKDFSSNYEIWYLRMKVKLNVNVAKEIVEKIKNV